MCCRSRCSLPRSPTRGPPRRASASCAAIHSPQRVSSHEKIALVQFSRRWASVFTPILTFPLWGEGTNDLPLLRERDFGGCAAARAVPCHAARQGPPPRRASASCAATHSPQRVSSPEKIALVQFSRRWASVFTPILTFPQRGKGLMTFLYQGGGTNAIFFWLTCHALHPIIDGTSTP